ncbi:nuclear transport factor 2 family protein [Pseudochryseolinea flava]|nr:nuclear transport factor 2 family protein [Pseudochryseolinea flava]
MKQTIIPFLLLLCSLAVQSYAQQQSSDEAAIKQVIQSAYIDGIQNGGSSEVIRSGFHPSFNMLRFTDNDIKPYAIEDWIAAIEKRKKENATVPPPAVGNFVSVDITGTAAVVKLELFRENKKTFTDYLVLYKFTDGWKIVSKTFYRHPN